MTIKMLAPLGQGGQVQGLSGLNYTIASDGSISNVSGQDVLPLIRAGFTLFSSASQKAVFNSPLPADLVSIKAAATPANGAITIAAQPPHARKLQIRVVLGTGGTTDITAGTLTLVGTDQDGNAISEVVSLITAAASATYKSKYAYATLTSGTVAAYAANGSGTGNTLGLGCSNDFGVPSVPGNLGVDLVCTKATKITKILGTSNIAADDVASTTTVDAVARTIAPTTAPAASGLVDYEFTYSFGLPG